MIPITLADDINTDPGCYVQGGWGWKGSGHLIEQFCVGEEELTLAHDYMNGNMDQDGDVDFIYDVATEVENALNDVLPDDRIASWRDGEFFIMTYCGEAENCQDEECACQY